MDNMNNVNNVNFDNRMTIEGNENMIVVAKEEYDDLLELVHRGMIASEIVKGYADGDIRYTDEVAEMVCYAMFGYGISTLAKIRKEEKETKKAEDEDKDNDEDEVIAHEDSNT